MIGETTNIGTLLNNERVGRNKPPQEERSEPARQEQAEQQPVSDTVTLSPEALALARNVPPAGDSSQVSGEQSRTGQNPVAVSEVGARFLDIRA